MKAMELHLRLFNRIVTLSIVIAGVVTVAALAVSVVAFTGIAGHAENVTVEERKLSRASAESYRLDEISHIAADEWAAAEADLNAHFYRLATGQTRDNDIRYSSRKAQTEDAAYAAELDAVKSRGALARAQRDLDQARDQIEEATTTAWIVAGIAGFVILSAWIIVISVMFRRSRARIAATTKY